MTAEEDDGPAREYVVARGGEIGPEDADAHPCPRRKQAARRRCRIYVTIDLEAGDAEEDEHHADPGPQENLRRRNLHARAPSADRVYGAAERDDAPGKKPGKEGRDIQRVIEGAVRKRLWLRDVVQVAGKRVLVHEVPAEGVVHPDEPRQRQQHAEHRAGHPPQREQRRAAFSAAREADQKKRAGKHQRDRPLRHDRKAQQDVQTRIEAAADSAAPRRARTQWRQTATR